MKLMVLSNMQSHKSDYIVSDIDLIKFRRGEKQFLKWIQELEKRMYKNDPEITNAANGNTTYSCNIYQMSRMENCIKAYQAGDPKRIAQDRFAWTIFANDLMKGHKERHVRHSCSTKLCLLLLLWSSYYLKFSRSKEVQNLLRHIIFCTRNVKFLFSFLPGMSMTSYILNFVFRRCDEKDLCKEFFVTIQETTVGVSESRFGLYRCFSPLLFYCVENLTPFHSEICRNELENFHCMRFNENKFAFTLQSILDKAIVYDRKHTLLSISVDYKDAGLFKLLLRLGASAIVQRWDPRLKDFISVEQLIISSVNSLIASKCFFSLLADDSNSTFKSVSKMIDAANKCGIIMQRSLPFPKARKSDNVWREKNWRYELNSEAADVWGIGYKQTLPSLRHMAKIAIRQQVLCVDKKRLPDAISGLPLPGPLKSYLNLSLDG